MKKLILGIGILMVSLSIQSCSSCCSSCLPPDATTQLLPFFVNNGQQTKVISQDNFTSAEDLLK